MTIIKSFPSLSSLCALTLVASITTACGCLPCDGDSSSNSSAPMATSYIQMAPMAPPEMPADAIDVPDSTRTQIWRPGYWDYNGSDFHWVGGEMIDRPSPTAVWSADHWVQHTYGWGFVPGYWQ